MVKKLLKKGFGGGPIVCGNFVKNEALKFIDYEIYGELKNAELYRPKWRFYWKSSLPILEAIEQLQKL